MHNMAYPDPTPNSVPRLALFTRNGILGDSRYADMNWPWREVIEKSTLRAEWNRAAYRAEYREDIELRFYAKVRIMMKGLDKEVKSCTFGSTTRAAHGGKTTEMHKWSKFWTGRDIFVEV